VRDQQGREEARDGMMWGGLLGLVWAGKRTERRLRRGIEGGAVEERWRRERERIDLASSSPRILDAGR